MKTYILAAIVAYAVTALPASAQTTIGPGGSALGGYQLNAPGFIGQTFTSPGSVLTDFDFTDVSGSGGSTKFVVTTFNNGAFGQPLFSQLITVGSGPIDISGIDLPVTQGSAYVAYLTNIGVDNAARYLGIGAYYPGYMMPFVDYYLGGVATAYNVETDPAGGANFRGTYDTDLAFTATFASGMGAVPELATWAMMLVGFGTVGFAMRRRQKVTTLVSYAT